MPNDNQKILIDGYPLDYRELMKAWLEGALPAVDAALLRKNDEENRPLSLHSVEYYRYQNAALKAKGRKKKRRKK